MKRFLQFRWKMEVEAFNFSEPDSWNQTQHLIIINTLLPFSNDHLDILEIKSETSQPVLALSDLILYYFIRLSMLLLNCITSNIK